MKKMMMSLKSSRMILHIGEKPIFCVGISSAWAGVVAKLEEEEYDVGLQMEFSLPNSQQYYTKHHTQPRSTPRFSLQLCVMRSLLIFSKKNCLVFLSVGGFFGYRNTAQWA